MFPKTNIPNPLNFLNCRKFNKKPKGMEFIEILNSSPDSDKLIAQWGIQNLKSRYYIGKHIKVSKTDNLIHSFLVGFEDPKEMSIFNLSCPHIKLH